MRIRTIKPEFWHHPVICRLPDDVQLIALGLLSAADDEGYFRAEPRIIRADIAPFRDDLARISLSLSELSRVGWITLANHPEHGPIGRIAKWDFHQKVDHPKPSRLKGYFLASNSREPREGLAPDQGSGIRDQGSPTDERENADSDSGDATVLDHAKPASNGGSHTPKRLHGLPSCVEEVIEYGRTCMPLPIPEETCRAFWDFYEGQIRTNSSGDTFWITSGGLVVTQWRSKLPSFDRFKKDRDTKKQIQNVI